MLEELDISNVELLSSSDGILSAQIGRKQYFIGRAVSYSLELEIDATNIYFSTKILIPNFQRY